MPIGPLVAGGVGFTPGSVRFLPTLGLTPGAAATTLSITRAGLPNEVCVKVVVSESGWPASQQIRGGYLEIFAGGQWHRGTDLLPSHGLPAVELHGRCFGLAPNTEYSVRVTFQRFEMNSGVYYVTGNGLEFSESGTVIETITETANVTTMFEDGVFPTTPTRTELYIDTVNGLDSYDGSSPTHTGGTTGPKLSLTAIDALVNNVGGHDIYYVGPCTFLETLTGISGTANNWNRFLPYDENASIIGYIDLDGDAGVWDEVGDGIWKMDDPGQFIGRVMYRSSTGHDWEGKVLFQHRCYDAEHQIPNTGGVPSAKMAIDASPGTARLTGTITNVAVTTNTYTITSTGHGLTAGSVGDWLRVTGVTAVGINGQHMINELVSLHRIASVPNANTFTVTVAGTANQLGAGCYVSGGQWEIQKLPGWYQKRSTGEVFVRMLDGTSPGTGRLRGCYKAFFLIPTELEYVKLDVRCYGAGAQLASSTDSNLVTCNSSSNHGYVRLVTCSNLVVTGAVYGGGLHLDQTWPSTNIFIRDFVAGHREIWDAFMAEDATVWLLSSEVYDVNSGTMPTYHHGAYQPIGLSIQGGTNIAVRNATLRGSQVLMAGALGTRNVSLYNSEFSYCSEDVLELDYLDGSGLISGALYHNHIHHGDNISMAPMKVGPFFFIGNYVEEVIQRFFKIGGSEGGSLAWMLVANNTFRNERDVLGASSGGPGMNGPHSGLISVNNIYVCMSPPWRPALMNGASPATSAGAEDFINYWKNDLWHLGGLGSPVDRQAASGTVVTGTVASGTYASTHARDGTYYRINPTTADGDGYTLFFYLSGNAGTDSSIRSFEVYGYQSGSPTPAEVLAWNWSAPSGSEWEKIGVFPDVNAFGTIRFVMETRHTAANGDWRLGFRRSDNPSTGYIALDYVIANHIVLEWDSTDYATFAAMHAAQATTDISITDQTITATYPVDEDGVAIAAWDGEAVDVPGITNIAAHDGVALAEPIRLGYFNEFSYE